MAFRKLFNRKPPPSVAEMRVDEDVDGLVRALGDPSPTVVRDAASALGSLHLHGAEASRQHAAAAEPALVAAFMRQQAEIPNLGAAYQMIEQGDRRTAQWAIVDALGTIRASGSTSLLQELVEDPHADAHLRGRAAAALGRIAGDSHFELLRRTLEASDTPVELAEGAVAGLLAAGDAGAGVIQRTLAGTKPSDFVAAVKKVLERECAGEYQERAKRLLSASAEEAAWQAGQRAVWEEAVVAKRIAAFPLTAKLASSLGHPEWTAGENLIRAPGAVGYAEAVEACRSLGLSVEEVETNPEVRVLRNVDDFGREETAEETTCDLTATVRFEGSPIAITGGVRVRRVDR